jgi:putative SOS response-associated peptidase YedK
MNKIFYMAGIYNENGCAIVTKESDQNINHIHHRQPLILDNINMMNWLNKVDLSNRKNINKVNYYQVSQMVNSPLNNNRKCVERI